MSRSNVAYVQNKGIESQAIVGTPDFRPVEGWVVDERPSLQGEESEALRVLERVMKRWVLLG